LLSKVEMAEAIERKRFREDKTDDVDSLAVAAKRRKSRFDSDGVETSNHSTDQLTNAISSASAKAALMSKDVASKPGFLGFTAPSIILGQNPLMSHSSSLVGVDAGDKMAQAAEMQRQLAAQMASVSSMLSQINKKPKADRKAAYRPLLLDEQGRQVDEQGNVVKIDVQQVKTLAANVSEVKKKENPYLMHASDAVDSEPVDDRIASLNNSRDVKGKKALKFIEAGANFHCIRLYMH
jgi:hypothetical protein